MADNKGSKIVADKMVVAMAYTLTVDGEFVDSTEDGEWLVFIQGYGSIIPGLEDQLYGMAEGEKRNITVPHQEAYGEYDIDQIVPIQ